MISLGQRANVLKYQLAVSLARALGDPLMRAHSIRHLADAYRRRGQAELAEPAYQEALSIYREHQEAKPLDLANALRGLAILKESTGAHSEARRLWQEAHDLYVKVDVSSGVAESAARLAALGI